MSKYIVVGVDFSSPSLAAVRWTIERLAADQDVVLVHAIHLPQPPSFLRNLFAPTDQAVANAQRGAEARLDEFRAQLKTRRIIPEIRVGKPDHVLLDVVGEYDAELVVIGAHGERSGLGKLLGSTAERVARRAKTSVLLARAVQMKDNYRLVVALDESNLVPAIIKWAVRLQTQLPASTAVLHVVNPLLYGTSLVAASEHERRRATQGLRQAGEDWLKQQLANGPLENAALDVALGSVPFEILAAAQRYDADMLVLGRHGSGARGGSFLGSVVEFVLRNGSQSVLIVAGAD